MAWKFVCLTLATFIIGSLGEERSAVPEEATSGGSTKGDAAPLADYQAALYRTWYMRSLAAMAASGKGYAPTSKGYVPLAMASKGYVPLAMASKGYVPLAMASKGYVPLAMAPGVKGYYPTYYSTYMAAYYRKLALKRMMEAQQRLQAAAAAGNTKGSLARAPPPPPGTCKLPKDHGPCIAVAAEKRYYFNKDTQRCEPFIYGKCGGNANNFKTERECQSACACVLPSKRGVCLASLARWTYNKDTAACEVFIYGGCFGNANNFMSKTACEATC